MNLLLLLVLLTLSRPVLGTRDACKTCGLRPAALGEDASRVTRGRDAPPGAWPWIVSLQQVWNSGMVHVCAGSLISPRWVLTAAHCFINARNVPLWRVLAGVTHLAQEVPELQVRLVRRLLLHQDYEEVSQKNDVALVELEEPVGCGPFVQPLCVPDPAVNLSAMTKCYVSGWGTTSSKAAGSPLVLQEAQVHLIESHVCNSSGWHRGDIQPTNLCAGFPRGGSDTCKGDSGGPLVCQDPHGGHFWLVGVTSWGRGCARAHRPGIYTATQSFHHWILTQTGLESTGPTTPSTE